MSRSPRRRSTAVLNRSPGRAILAPSFSLTSPTGLVGWWDASLASSITSSSGRVTQWNDRSTSGFHLTATGTARPTTGVDTRNGLNTLKFDGVANGMFAAASVPATNTMTVFAVIYPTATTTGERVVSLDASGNDFGGSNRIAAILRNTGDANYFTFYCNGVSPTGGLTAPNTNAIHQVTTRRNGDSCTAWVDGGTPDTGTGIGTTNFAIDTINVGQYGGEATPSGFYTGDICEVLWYNAALSTGDRQLVEAYLKAKWGTP